MKFAKCQDGSITVNMTPNEARTIMKLSGIVTGSASSTRRAHTDRMYYGLEHLGVTSAPQSCFLPAQGVIRAFEAEGDEI